MLHIIQSIHQSFQWLRGKYISRLIATHSCFSKQSESLNSRIWTTREVVLFARLHAYTPVINENINIIKNGNTNSTDLLSSLVKDEIKRENQLCFKTITPHNKVSDWANETWSNINRYFDENDHELIIDVENVDDDVSEEMNAQTSYINTSPLKYKSGKVWFPIRKNLEYGANFVQTTCQEAQIRLQPEEIINGIV